MEFRVLGLLEVVDDGRPLPIGPGKERALLALLLMNANQPLSIDLLIDQLWNERRQPGNAAKTVQIYVSRLRGHLGRERIVTTPAGYMLRAEPGELDASCFEQLADEGQSRLEAGDPVRAEIVLTEALDLWRGAALADFRFAAFAQAEIGRLQELHGSAVADRVDARLALGRAEELITELEVLVREQPLWERPRRQLMLALYQAGRQADALELYQSTRRLLADQLGLDPSPELQALERAILNQAPELEKPPRPRSRVPRTTAGNAAETSRGVFVGRETELDQLTAGLEDSLSGRGRLFLLVGEPGIGKSRLAEEMAARANAAGARVLWGRCWEAGGAPAYWPWVQSLRGYVRAAEPDLLRAQLGAGAAELAQILPELREILSGIPKPVEVESDVARFRLFDAATEFLRTISEIRPIVLVLDDLHAADEPSLLLLQFLARELGSMRVLVFGTYRDVDPVPGRALGALQVEIAREPATRRLSLSGLSEGDVAEYVELTAAAIASPKLAAALHEETDGNPLFVGETLRLLAAEGYHAEAAGSGIAIPQSVRDVIARRLGHLSEECNRLLTVASVLGREFALAALARVSGLSVDEVLDTIDEAMAARVVSDVPGTPGRLRFAHVLIRDTLYELLTTGRRVRLHRQAVGALETLYGAESGPHLAELAHHAIAGSDFDRGLRYAQRAGDRALALLAYEEAARLYEAAIEALDLADARDENTRCELLLSLGQAQVRAGDTRAAKEAFLVAAGLARRLGLRRELARAAGGYAGEDMYLRAGHDDRLVPLLEEGLAALSDEDVELRARLLARLAGALRGEKSPDRRDGLSREAVKLARRTGSQAALVYALDGRIPAIIAPDTLGECLALAAELREVAEGIGDTERVLHGHLHLLIVLVMLGDLTEAEPGLNAMSRMAVELRQPAYLWEVHAGQATLALAAGRLTEAEQLIPQALAHGEHAKPDIAIPVNRLQRYMLCDFQGGLEEVEPTIRTLVADWPGRPAFRCALAHLHARLGRLPEAKQALDDLARDDHSALPFDQEWLFGMSLLAETSTLLSDSDSAAVLYRSLVPWAALNAADWPEGIRGSVSRSLGQLAATIGRPDDARGYFEAALEMNEQMGARPWLAQTQEDYARLLAQSDDTGDRERAQELLDQALATYRELGMEPHEVRASALASTY